MVCLRVIIVFLFLLLSFFAKGQDEDLVSKYKYEQVVEKFQTIENLLKSSFNGSENLSPTQCGIEMKNSNMSCQFKDFCKILSENIDRPYIYLDKNGGKIPNYALAAIEKQVSNCYMSVEAQFLNKQNNNKNEPQEEIYKQFNYKKNQARIELYEKVNEEGVATDFNKFERAAAEIEIEKIINDNIIAVPQKPDREEIKKDFLEISKRANVSLPNSVMDKYIASVEATYFSMQISDNNDDSQIRSAINQNPFLDMRLAINEKFAGSEKNMNDNQNKIKNATKRAIKIFEDTQKGILDLLDQKIKKQSQNRDKYSMMKKRIMSIRYTPPPTDIIELSKFCPAPNAFYNPFEHAFLLCPQIMEFPESSLKAIIAHELAHSIDPCIMSQPLLQITDIKETKGRKQQITRLAFELETPKYTDHYIVDFLGKAQSKLEEQYEKFEKSTYSDPIFFKDNPALDVINCLTSKSSVGARTNTKEQTKKNLEDAISLEKKYGTQENDPKYKKLISALKDFDKIYDEVGACGFLPGNSQIEEAWSDWIAAEVLGQDVKNKKDNDKMNFAFESFGFLLAMECKGSQPKILEQSNQFMEEMGCIVKVDQNRQSQIKTINGLSSLSQNVHPDSIDRVEKIFLGHPELKKALGCGENEGVKHCE